MNEIARQLSILVLVAICASCGSGSPSAGTPASSPVDASQTSRMGEGASPSATVGPAASPSPSQVPIPALGMTFASPLMGYSVMYPADWTSTPATQPWLPDAGNYWDDPVGDRLEGAAVGFRGTSQPLDGGQSAEAWLADYLGSGFNCGDREQVPVGGAIGTIDLNGCTGRGRLGGRVFDVAVVSGGRGYNFTMEGNVDHAFFLAMLATVRFAPKSAIDTPASPSATDLPFLA